MTGEQAEEVAGLRWFCSAYSVCPVRTSPFCGFTMAEILELLKSPAWWFQAILVGLAVNIVSHFLIKSLRHTPIFLIIITYAYILFTIAVCIYALVASVDLSPKVYHANEFGHFARLMDDILIAAMMPLFYLVMTIFFTHRTEFFNGHTRLPTTIAVAISFPALSLWFFILATPQSLNDFVKVYLLEVGPGVGLAAMVTGSIGGALRYSSERRSTQKRKPRTLRTRERSPRTST